MAKGTPVTEQYQHFLSNLRESFWGDVYGTTRLAWQKFWEADSARQRDRFAVVDAYERNEEQRRDYRNGYYERDFVTVLGTIRLRIARTRGRSFLPAGLEQFQRRAPEVSNVDSGGVSAGYQYETGGASSGDHDWRSSQRADGLKVKPRLG